MGGHTLRLLVGACLAAASAHAAVWLPGSNIVVTASSAYTALRAPRYAVNGAGMSGECHASASADGTNWMASTASGQWIKLDLGAVRALDSLRIWNFNWKTAAGMDYTGRGVKQCDLYVSAAAADPGATFPGTWTLAVSNHVLGRAPGVPTYTGEAPISLAGCSARWLALQVDSNHDAAQPYVGLSEVRVYLADPRPQLRVDANAVLEGDAGSSVPARFDLWLDEPADVDVVVAYATTNGSAVAGADYTGATGTVTIAAGTTNACVEVMVTGDNAGEPDETFGLRMAPDATVQPAELVATGCILNDDPLSPSVAALPATGVSAGSAILHASVVGGLPLPSATFFWGEADAGTDAALWAHAADATLSGLGVVSLPVSGLSSNTTYHFRCRVTNAAGTAWTDAASFRTVVRRILLEAESFSSPGGWSLDTQFVDQMGSPYLLAHGLGEPVADAVTDVAVGGACAMRLWVRTRDWCADHVDAPGRFRVAVDGVETTGLLGTNENGWAWQDAGMITTTGITARVALRDLTGYDGRCDALYLTTAMEERPPDDAVGLAAWRAEAHGWPSEPPDAGAFDAVIVGGGMAGTCAAVAAARGGARVALIQDRPVFGGNCSQEVRVHTLGVTPAGSIVAEVNANAIGVGSPASIAADARRQSVLDAETNIVQFAGWRAYGVVTNAGLIVAVDARDMRAGSARRFRAPMFIDCTGDGWLGFWAGADWSMGREARSVYGESLAPLVADTMTMGSTLLFNSFNTGAPYAMAPVPWATAVAGTHAATTGDWFWEVGFQQNTIHDAEWIRDHLLRAIYGSFYNAKQAPAYANYKLKWVGYVAGKRESRRLLGDHILTEQDVRGHPIWDDAVVQESRSIDIHRPQGGSAPGFYSTADYTSISTYWIPYRSLYSRNVGNLLMAGRCFSCSHVGLGSPRVMNTGGQMGVAVGYAAALCKRHGVTPRGVYEHHLDELQALIGGIPETPPTMPDPDIVVDNLDAEWVGDWTSSTSVSGYHGTDYVHDGDTAKGTKRFIFPPTIERGGLYRVYLRWTMGDTRASNVPVDVIHADGTDTFVIDQRANGNQWVLLGTYRFEAGTAGSVQLRTGGTDGHVVADAAGFSEVDRDSDGDGLPDWWEVKYFMVPDDAAAPDLDPDADGTSNYAEWRAGTDPTNALSRFDVAAALRAGATYDLAWPSASNRLYTIQFTDDLSQPFGPLQEHIAATPPTNSTAVPVITGTRFFRILAEQ